MQDPADGSAVHVSRRPEMPFPRDFFAINMNLMNYEYFERLLKARPFEPFAVHLSSGEVHAVRYPNFAILTRTRLVIADPDADQIVVCSLLHIASVEMLQIPTTA
jgi:hypothetical protein